MPSGPYNTRPHVKSLVSRPGVETGNSSKFFYLFKLETSLHSQFSQFEAFVSSLTTVAYIILLSYIVYMLLIQTVLQACTQWSTCTSQFLYLMLLFTSVDLYVYCVTLAFVDELGRMLKIIRRFGKHCSCHLQGECTVVGRFWKPSIGQALRWWLVYLLQIQINLIALQMQESHCTARLFFSYISLNIYHVTGVQNNLRRLYGDLEPPGRPRHRLGGLGSKWNLGRLAGRVWSGVTWLRTGTGGGLL
jgi:hypothetical protein